MDRIITIQHEPAGLTDDDGMPIDGYVDLFANIKAARKYKSANESQEAGKDTVRQSVIYTVRYSGQINTNCIVIENGVRFEIRSIEEIGRRQGLEMMCESIV
ncbi:MAG: phage head closure protein [Roseivirga sp.]|nr:phage head closure protein [Roseivirga sp.]